MDQTAGRDVVGDLVFQHVAEPGPGPDSGRRQVSVVGDQLPACADPNLPTLAGELPGQQATSAD